MKKKSRDVLPVTFTISIFVATTITHPPSTSWTFVQFSCGRPAVFVCTSSSTYFFIHIVNTFSLVSRSYCFELYFFDIPGINPIALTSLARSSSSACIILSCWNPLARSTRTTAIFSFYRKRRISPPPLAS